jgi:hypothetical protein
MTPAAAKTAPEAGAETGATKAGATKAAKAGPTKAGPTKAGPAKAGPTEAAEKSTRHTCRSFPDRTIKFLDTTDCGDVNKIDGSFRGTVWRMPACGA